MAHYEITFKCPECGKTLALIYEGLSDDTPAKINQRNPKFREQTCPSGHLADYYASAAIGIVKAP
jgi:hypothetical protein